MSNVTLNNKDIDLIVRFKEGNRQTLEDLKKVVISDLQGNLVKLGVLATFKIERGTPQIKRYNFKRSRTLTGDVDVTKVTSIQVNKILLETFEKNKHLIPGVSLVFGGAQESTNESITSLFSALKLSLVGIFALLVFLFKSYLRL